MTREVPGEHRASRPREMVPLTGPPCAHRRGMSLTYRELWAASEALAEQVGKLVERGMPVIVYGNKDPFMVVCFLACMKAGCPYVPIDGNSVPPQRAPRRSPRRSVPP
ncbi:MAG: AMP-binding protein [Collinsella sp.]